MELFLEIWHRVPPPQNLIIENDLSGLCPVWLVIRTDYGWNDHLSLFFVYLQYVFDYHPGDIFACVADIGWITGHSYVIYGPLCNGGTTVMFESIPTYPNPGTCVHDLWSNLAMTKNQPINNSPGMGVAGSCWKSQL